MVTLKVSPLRDRPGDIPILAQRFAVEIARRMGRRPIELTPKALDLLRTHAFPGNVRELRNIIERLTILSDGRVEVADLRDHLPIATDGRALYRPGVSLRDLVQEAEKAIIEAAIADNDGNKSATARALGVDRSHFYKECGLLGLG